MTIEFEKTFDWFSEKIQEMANSGLIKAYEQDNLYDWYYDSEYPDEGYLVSNGCTRYVLFFDECAEYVIKFDKQHVKHSYCSREVEVYSEAVKDNQANYFARIMPLITIDGVDFYLQERADCCEESIEDMLFEYSEKWVSEEMYEGRTDAWYSARWEAMDEFDTEDRLNAIYGEHDDTNELVQFCYKNKVNDLHQGNFGYNSNGFPIMIDYCGYFG